MSNDASDLYYRKHAFMCTNRRDEAHKRGSCAARDSERLLRAMKDRVKELGLTGVRVNASGCLDRCEGGPCLVIYPEGVWYSPKTEADALAIVDRHLQHDERVASLMLPAHRDEG